MSASTSAAPFLPFTRPTIDDETIAGVCEVLRSGWITSGPQVKAFEAKLSEYFGGRPVRAFNSGTCTMEIALRIAGIGAGHEVITTPLSWVSTSNVILEVGARPVFVDIDPVTRNIDLDRIAARLGQNPGALLATLAAAPTQGQIRFTNFATSGLRANELAATLTTQGGVLRADPLRAQLYGGSLSGSLRYQGANTLLALDQKFDGINLAALASDLHRPLPLRGELSGHWQLQSSLGRNTVASTSGRASLALRRAQWQGMDFDALLRSVRPALKGRGKAERASQPREHQDLDALAIDCAIASGSASCSGFSGATPWLRLGGGGRLALSPAKLDWLLRIAVQSHGRIPREFKGLAGLTVPLRISGPLNRPLWRLDWDGAAPTATRQAPLRPQAPTAPASAAG